MGNVDCRMARYGMLLDDPLLQSTSACSFETPIRSGFYRLEVVQLQAPPPSPGAGGGGPPALSSSTAPELPLPQEDEGEDPVKELLLLGRGPGVEGHGAMGGRRAPPPERHLPGSPFSIHIPAATSAPPSSRTGTSPSARPGGNSLGDYFQPPAENAAALDVGVEDALAAWGRRAREAYGFDGDLSGWDDGAVDGGHPTTAAERNHNGRNRLPAHEAAYVRENPEVRRVCVLSCTCFASTNLLPPSAPPILMLPALMHGPHSSPTCIRAWPPLLPPPLPGTRGGETGGPVEVEPLPAGQEAAGPEERGLGVGPKSSRGRRGGGRSYRGDERWGL